MNKFLVTALYIVTISSFFVTSDILALSVRPPEFYTVTKSFSEPIPFQTIYEENNDLTVGTQEIRIEGKDGIASKTYEISYRNSVEESRKQVGYTLIAKPADRVIVSGTSTAKEAPLGNRIINNTYLKVILVLVFLIFALFIPRAYRHRKTEVKI
jgi:hypothetical protein